MTSSRVQGVLLRTFAARLSRLIIQSDPVRGQRSRCDYRLWANSGSLQERGELEKQLLVKTLFIRGELTELRPAARTATCSLGEHQYNQSAVKLTSSPSCFLLASL